MKRFLIPLLAVLALPTTVEACVFGNCGSKLEAENACENWKEKGGSYTYLKTISEWSGPRYTDDLKLDGYAGYNYKDITRTQNLRKCIEEEETNKILGLLT